MTWKDLQQPTTSKKQPETTYHNLKRPIMNKKQPGNNPQWVRHNLKWLEPTCNKQKKDVKRPIISTFWDYFTIWSNQFSSLTYFQPNIWLKSFEHCFSEYHGENKAPNISISSCVFITGYKNLWVTYVVNHFDTCKLTFVRQKSTLWIKQKKSNFDIDETFRALKVTTWLFSAHHT